MKREPEKYFYQSSPEFVLYLIPEQKRRFEDEDEDEEDWENQYHQLSFGNTMIEP
jgi:hypothetical protein